MHANDEKIAIFTIKDETFESIKRYLHYVLDFDSNNILKVDQKNASNIKGCQKFIFELDYSQDSAINSEQILLKVFANETLSDIQLLLFSSYDIDSIFRLTSVEFFLRKAKKEYEKKYGLDFTKECMVHSTQLACQLEKMVDGEIKPVSNYYGKVWEILNTNGLKIGNSEKNEILKRVSNTEYELNLKTKRDRIRKSCFHGAKSNEEELIMQMLSDLIVESIYFEQNIKKKSKKDELNILWLENNPEGEIFETNVTSDKLKKCLHALKWTFKFFSDTNIFLRQNHFEELFNEIENGSGSKIRFDQKIDYSGQPDSGEAQVNLQVNLKDIDFLILDIFLDSAKHGEDFIDLFMKKHPEIPILILSASEDYELVESCLNKGADFFINKKFIFSLPLFIHKTYEKYGELLWLSLGDSYQRALLGNIRYWMHHKDYLWYGDKCYHMIDHGFKHTYDNWKHSNQLIPLSLSFMSDKKNISEHDIYSFSMATWLHDIGHKGNKNYSEAHQIRDTHGLISGEIVVKNPALFNIIEEDSNEYDSYYSKIEFPHGPTNIPITQFILERKNYNNKYQLSNLEKTALLCIYHKSNGPLTKQKGEEMISSGKHIPKEFFFNSNNKSGKLISLEGILDQRLNNNDTEKQKFLGLTTFFRFIDGLDIHDVRVGDYSEKALKTKVINQDKKYFLNKLQNEIGLIINRLANDNTALALQIHQQLYQIPVEKIGKGEFKLDAGFRSFIEKELGRLDDYWMILNYAQFISVQDGHFDLHSSVSHIDISTIYDDKEHCELINIVFTINKDFDIKRLMETKVREMRKSPTSLLEKLFGNKQKGMLPYTLDELKEGASVLNPYLNLENGIYMTLKIPGNNNLKDIAEIIEAEDLSKSSEDNITFKRKFILQNSKLIIKDWKE
ncbi:MAG: response regulator [bacterium]